MRISRKSYVLACFFLPALSACGPGNFGNDEFFPPTAADRARAVELASDARLVAAAERIRTWHERNNTGLVLNDAMSREEFLAATAKFDCALPAELLALWRWRNGESSENFTWYHRFLSVEDSLAEYRSLKRNILRRWDSSWIPVLEFQEEWYFVECGDVAGSPVSLYFAEDGPIYAYVNLTSFLSTMAAAMERGALVWKDDGWNQDDGALVEIYRELNVSGHFPYATP